MAKHHGCPECEQLYPWMETNGSAKGESSKEQRAGQKVQNGESSPTTNIFNPYYTGRPRTPVNGSKQPSIDRDAIIKRIKSRESRPASPEVERPSSRSSLKQLHGRKSPTPEEAASSSMDVSLNGSKPVDVQQDNQAVGMQIERPRSALHRGDFREKEESISGFERFGDSARDEPAPSLSTSPVAPWHPDFPATIFRQSRPVPTTPPGFASQRPARARATSTVSLANGLLYKATSPLVRASRPDTPEPRDRSQSRSPDKSSRRHTISPQFLQHQGSTLDDLSNARAYGHRKLPSFRQEKSEPAQAHQPCRSLNSFASLPQTPASGSRRPSFSGSPLHAAMVGSYEESILRGRMSTTPSKPLNFVAQIGVLGKGDCKPSLKCPPHATVPFPAVFYSYNASSSRVPSTEPSPYVGLVDLENNLPPVISSPEKRRQRLQAALSPEGSRSNSRAREDTSASDAQARKRRKQKQKRRSRSPKAPPGGSYRIPQQGQLQIVLKNPNKTAVKLFLIPYDLSDMEPGQKTFIRQRSYSAGPIIDMPLSSRTNLGTNVPEASLNATDDPNDRPVLRYLIHLHICCPAKGRYFLYKSIRVVFANRVPDGKERLRNEIQLPEPRYSTYKPGRDSNVGLSSSTTPQQDRRRQSASEGNQIQQSELRSLQSRLMMAQSLPNTEYNPQFDIPLHQPNFQLRTLPTLESRPTSRQMSDGTMSMDVDSEQSQETESNRSQFSSPSSKNSSHPFSPVRKLEDPFHFERDRSRERRADGRSESLIAMRLKDLAFMNGKRDGEEDV